MMDALSAIAHLHNFYDGEIPAHQRAIARLGSAEPVALMAARGNRRFYREMARGQVRAIRMRREDGTFYPSMIEDLALYLRRFRDFNREVVELERAATRAQREE